MHKLPFKLKFLLIPIAIVVLNFGWVKWPSILSQPLNSSISPNREGSSLLGESYYQISVPPTKSDQYTSTDYRLWLPSSATKIRKLVKEHRCSDLAAESSLEHASNLQWQVLTANHQLGLFGTKLPIRNKPYDYWELINYGSGKTFLKALNTLAAKSNHPELAAAPWALWGHSGGADWAAQMLQQYPQRPISLVSVHCGGFTFFGYNPQLSTTPILFALEANEPTHDEFLNLPQEAFYHYRKLALLRTLPVEANAAHEASNSHFLAILYLSTMIGAHLPVQGNQLLSVEPFQGWLGNNVTYVTDSINRYKGELSQTSWLPSQSVAQKWQKYVTKGRVSPTRRLSIPHNVRIRKDSSEQVMMSWDRKPNLENSLQSFRIYRDKTLLATGEGQVHDFNDAPIVLSFELTYKDKGSRTSVGYRVTAFNNLGEASSSSIKLDNL
jgi:hypothetical protein